MNTVAIYLRYKKKRESIKARHRIELESELEPYKSDLGEAFLYEKEINKLRIEDIAALLGTKNRRVFYDMVKAFKRAHTGTESQPEHVTVMTGDDYTDADSENFRESIFWEPSETNPGYMKVSVNTFGAVIVYEVLLIDGLPVVPDEWANHTKTKRALYSEFVKGMVTFNKQKDF